jgi:hypothetical protein
MQPKPAVNVSRVLKAYALDATGRATVAARRTQARARETQANIDRLFEEGLGERGARERRQSVAGEYARKLEATCASAREGGARAVGRVPPEAVERTGAAVRRVAHGLSKVPLIGVSGQAVQACHGVALLAERVRVNPQHPVYHLWLAEALLRTERDATRVRVARGATSAVLNPASLVFREAIRASVTLARADDEPASRRVLRSAWCLACARVRHDPADHEALHVMARVYLAHDMNPQAAQFAGLAAGAGAPAESLVTRARALCRDGQLQDAQHEARRAVQRGCSLGNEVLGEVLAARLRAGDDPDTAALRRAYAELGPVRREDRTRYCGFAQSAREAASTVASAEREKASALLRRRARHASKEKDDV